jgi:hypothetical protein
VKLCACRALEGNNVGPIPGSREQVEGVVCGFVENIGRTDWYKQRYTSFLQLLQLTFFNVQQILETVIYSSLEFCTNRMP